MLFNYQWGGNYEELITFYPKYYYDVLEMIAILKAQGKILDEFMDNTQVVFDDCFIDTMDEATVTQLEEFLLLKLYKKRTLEERRRLLKTMFVGHGRLSADLIKQTVSAYTGDEVDVYLEPIEQEVASAYYTPGDNRLYINYLRGEADVFYMNDIDTLVSRLIPAHLSYQSALMYRFAVTVSPKRKRYIKDFDLCGTLPDIATVGISAGGATVADTTNGIVAAEHFAATFPFAGAAGYASNTLGLSLSGATVVNTSDGLVGRLNASVTYTPCGTAVCHDGP